jgi:hypothetical protein
MELIARMDDGGLGVASDRTCYRSRAAMANLIPMPAEHAPDKPIKVQCGRNSYLSKTDARTPQIPIDRCARTHARA